MTTLKGMMSGKRALFLVSAVIIISAVGLFTILIRASPDSLTVRVANIENNGTITVANVSLWNCSNPTQMLASNTTQQNGTAFFEVTGGPWNVSITVNFSGYFINKTDNNGGNCYLISGDSFMTEEVYRNNMGSFNITIVDSVNGRPVPNVNVSVFREGAIMPEIQKWPEGADNYRCPNGVCTTGSNGNKILIVSVSGEPCGRYFFSIEDKTVNYLDKNTSFFNGPCAGRNENVIVGIDGSQSIKGYIFDKYNTNLKISGANVTLWNHSSPSKMIGWEDKYFYYGLTDASGWYEIKIPANLLQYDPSSKYDVKVEAANYVTTYNKSWSDAGWQGYQRIDLTMTGPLQVNGTVIDITNGKYVNNAEVRIYNESEAFEYTTYTNSQGSFNIMIRNNTGYSVKASASGYNDNITTPLQGSIAMGNITLKGKAHIVGKVIDAFRDQSGNEIPLSTNINFDSTYQTTSNATGDFSIDVKSGVTYSLSVSKTGYFTYTSSLNIPLNPSGDVDIGTRSLSGRQRIYGTIYDAETKARYTKLDNVTVLVHDSYHTYKVVSNTYGNYTLNVSSYNNNYYLELQRTGFDVKILNNSGSNYTASPSPGFTEINAQMTGSTTVTGKVADEYSPIGSTLPIASAVIIFKYKDQPIGNWLYNITSSANGDFSVNLGVTGAYDIYVSKSGYDIRTFNNLGSGYVPGDDISFNNATNDYLRLRGTAHVNGSVLDNKSNEYVYDSVVTLYEKSSGLAKYWKSVNGTYDFWVDGTMSYELEADAEGYPKNRDSGGAQGYKGTLHKNITLKAQFQAILKDAENTAFGIPNSRVRLYHYYNQSYFGPDVYPTIAMLNETKLNVSVMCAGNGSLSGINVTLVKMDGCLGYQNDLGLCNRSQNITNGTTIFSTFAVGTYAVTVDGWDIGCGITTDTLTLVPADAGKLINKSYTITETILRIKVIDPVWFVNQSLGNLENANVTILTPGIYTNITPENNTQGVFTFHFVRSGTNNITANESRHFTNYSLYNVSLPGSLNNFAGIGSPTFLPLILQPLPANLSFYVLNSTGVRVDDGVFVMISNKTGMLVNETFFTGYNYNSTYNVTTINGWGNFSGIYASVYWNVTVNGTQQGYNYTTIDSVLPSPGNLTLMNITIRKNTLFVYVHALSGGSLVNVNNANVTLWNGTVGGSLIAQNGLGEELTALTNSSGQTLFARIVPGFYNVSINGTGFDKFETEISLEINENIFNPVLNDTTPPYYDNRSITIGAGHLATLTPKQGDVVNVDVQWADNALLEQAILQINESGPIVNKTYKALYGSSYWSNFTIDAAYTTQHAGEDIYVKVIARDSSNNWNTSMPWEKLHINDTEAPVVNVTHIPTAVVAGMEVVFRATISDNHNITWAKIYVDYDDKSDNAPYECNATNGGKNMTCTWKSAGYDYDTTHYYYAVAVDEEGNVGRDPVAELNVTISQTLPSGAGRSQGAAIYVSESYPEQIYIIGGQRDNAGAISNQIFNFTPRLPSTPGWIATMPEYRRAFASAYDNDTRDIYMFGGTTGANNWLTSILRFNVTTRNLTTRSGTIPSTQRDSPSAAYHRDGTYSYIYIFGGDNLTNGVGIYSDEISRYNITADSVDNAGNILQGTRSKTAAVYSPVNNKIYVIGGRNATDDIADILEYTPGASVTALAGSMPKGLEGVSVAYHKKTNKIYIFGGYNLNEVVYSNKIYEFDPQTNVTTTTNSTLPSPRAFTSAVFSDYDNKFYIFGGEDGSSNYYDQIVKYDPIYGKSFTVLMRMGNLTVNVNSGGAPVTVCGGWPTVTLSRITPLPNGKSFIDQTVSATGGQARFIDLYPELTPGYSYTVNGTSQGYNSVSGTVYVGQNENSATAALTVTNLTINVTNSTAAPVDGSYAVYYAGTTTLLTKCDNTQVTGMTGPTGIAYWDRILPCASCNLTVSKAAGSPAWASTLLTITAGQYTYLQIDPPGDTEQPSLGAAYPYYVDTIGDYNTLLINVTTNSSGSITPLEYVNITLLRSDGKPSATNITDAYGLAYVTVKDGVYNLSVSGEARGYDSFLLQNLKIGKLVFADGTTDGNGQILLIVDGQPMYTPLIPRTPSGGLGYYVRIETAGHGSYDSIEQAIGIFQGTYYDQARAAGNNDVNNSFTLNMYGLSMINGTVSDKYCIYTNCKVPGVTVKILSGVQGPVARYTKITDINGTYSVRVSPYTTDSYWNNPVNESYDVKTEKDGYLNYFSSAYGYSQGIKLLKYQNFTNNPELTGSGQVAGYVLSHEEPPKTIGSALVKFVATTSPSANQNILPNSNYYSTISTNGTGYFSMVVNPNYGPYKLSVETNQSTYIDRTVGPYSGSRSDITAYLYVSGTGSILFHVLDENGQGIQNINTYVVVPTYPDIVKATNQSGKAKVWSILADTYTVKINGTYTGYGVYQGVASVSSGMETTVNVTLPSTKINVTLLSSNGEGVTGATVQLRNASSGGSILASIETVNGTAVFNILPPGSYNVTFSGYKSLVYYQNALTLARLYNQTNLTESDAGMTINMTYVLNETRAAVKLVDYNGSALPNITVTLYNATNNATNASSYVATSDINGTALFREILPSSNYTILFSEAQLQSMGLVLQKENFSIGVLAGRNESTTNNVTITIGDVFVRFDVSNSTGNGIANVSISLLFNGSLAINGYNQTLNGTTGGAGSLEIHGVPNRTYSYIIDANRTGYGIWNGTKEVTIDNNLNRVNISGLNPLTITAYVVASTGQVKENVTVSVLYNGALVKNANDQDMASNVTTAKNYTNFTHLPVYPGVYTVTATSPRYFSASGTTAFGAMNPNITHNNLSFTLTERSVTVYVRYQGSPLDEGAEIALVNATDGSAVTGTNGSVIANQTGVTNNATFIYVPDGVYNITVNSAKYFNPGSWQFNATQIPLGVSTHTFNLTKERKITVIVRNSTGNLLEEGVNISIQNSTGDVVTSLNGSYLNVTGATNSVNFTHIPEGTHKINVTSNKYFSTFQTFATSGITQGNDTFSFTLRERTVYIYLRDTDGSVLDYGVNVSMTNSTGGQITGTNGSVIGMQSGRTNSATFNYVPDGTNLIVGVLSNDYFSQNWTFNTTDIATNSSHTFVMKLRTLKVSIYHITGAAVTETVNVSVLNATGDIVETNMTSEFLNGTTVSGSITFTGLNDGSYNISIESQNYTSKNVMFDTVGGDNNEVSAYLKKKGHGYFYVNVSATSGGSPLSGATVALWYNSTNEVDSRATNSSGIAVVAGNASVYGQNLTVRVSLSGYYTNETTQYTITDQELKTVIVTLSAIPSVPYTPPPGGGGTTGGTVGGGVVSETRHLGSVSANVPKSAKFTLGDTLRIEQIEVLTNQDAANVDITVKDSGKPAGASDPVSAAEGKVYKYVEITATNLPGTIIRKVTIDFKVAKSWVVSNAIIPEEIYMFRYSDGAWARLTTVKLSEDDRWYYYRATSPGFSIFAIAGYNFRAATGRMELTLLPLSLKGGECRIMYLSVKNLGGSSLSNIHVDPFETECCSFQTDRPISSLAAGGENSVNIRACAKRTTDRGTYNIGIPVVSDQTPGSASSSIIVTESYTETLTKQIQDLESKLSEIDESKLNQTGQTYLDTAKDKLDESTRSLQGEDFDSAITALGEARNYYDMILVMKPQEKTYLSFFFEWLMVNYIIIGAAAGIFIVFITSTVFVKRAWISRKLPAIPEEGGIGGGLMRGIKRSEEDIISGLMGVVRELEGRVNDIDAESLREREKKWHNKVKIQIEGIKKSIEEGEFDRAKRHLNDVELFIKMLELNASSD